jgi:hypothetical protein
VETSELRGESFADGVGEGAADIGLHLVAEGVGQFEVIDIRQRDFEGPAACELGTVALAEGASPEGHPDAAKAEIRG